MKIKVSTSPFFDSLEEYRPKHGSCEWILVAAGYGSGSPGGSGCIAYFLTKNNDGMWIMDSVTGEEGYEGNIEDFGDWDRSYREIVAICEDANTEITPSEIAEILYDAILKADGLDIEEPQDCYLLTFEQINSINDKYYS